MIKPIKDWHFLPEADLWLKDSDLDAFQKIWKQKASLQDNLDALAAKSIDVVTVDALTQKLSAAGVDPIVINLTLDLILLRQGAPQNGAERFAANVPKKAEMVSFTGHNGTAIIDSGRSKFLFRTTDYHGELLRFDSPGWPTGWRVLHLKVGQ